MRSDYPKFIEWLRANGAEILPLTNSYEVARFVAHGKVNVIYEGRRGIGAQGFAMEAWVAFQSGMKLLNMGFTQTARSPMAKMRLALSQRDGNVCFYCGKPMWEDDVTIEHLVARGKGGPDHQDNLALAHEECNKKAANLPLIEKIKLRERLQHERYSHTPA